MTCRWDHIHYKCSDHEKTAAWFKEMLGAEEVGRFEVNAMPVITLKVGGQNVNFSPKKPGETVDSPVEGVHYGIYHTAVCVEDLDRTAAFLKFRGVRFTQEPKVLNPKTKFSFVEGPDGISVEILERK